MGSPDWYSFEGNGRKSIRFGGKEIKRVNKFKYLGSIISADGSMEEKVKPHMQASWNSWRAASGVLCNNRVPLRHKGKFHKMVVRTTMHYGTETASLRKTDEKKMDVGEIRMLSWMSGLTRKDRIRNDYIRGSTKVLEISKNVQQGRLRWYRHLLRREEDRVGMHTIKIEVQGRRRRLSAKGDGRT
ncbi:uncharacterized protein [Palaemon carinicauda]|uniref:uncharacterized protein n=1 Tax=Palaemon carinicauda TaxID=392227 RepID=UPI0035B5E16D